MWRVVLVDDEPGVVDGLAVMVDWTSFGFEIIGTASDGEEALALIEESEPDLVFTDIRMPEMDGIDLIRAAQNDLSTSVRFVIVSGYRDFEYARTAITLGVEDYLLKPIYEEDLGKTLEAISERLRTDAPGDDQNGESISAAILNGGRLPVGLRSVVAKPFHLVAGRIDDPPFATDADRARARLWRYSERILKLERNSGRILTLDGCPVSVLSARAVRRQYGTVHNYIEKLHSYVSVGAPSSYVYTGELIGEEALRSVAAPARRLLDLLRIDGPDAVVEAGDLLRRGAVNEAGQLRPDPNLIHSIADGDESAIESALESSLRAARSAPVEPALVVDYARKLCFEMHRLVTDLGGNPSTIDELGVLCRIELRAVCVATIFRLILEAARSAARHLRAADRRRPSARLQRVREDLVESFTRDVTIRELARRHAVSPAYLGQLFRKEYGESFTDYRNRLRVEEAARYLRTTDMRVYEIAAKVGYQSTDYFERRFQALYGTTPTQYRAEYTG